MALLKLPKHKPTGEAAKAGAPLGLDGSQGWQQRPRGSGARSGLRRHRAVPNATGGAATQRPPAGTQRPPAGTQRPPSPQRQLGSPSSPSPANSAGTGHGKAHIITEWFGSEGILEIISFHPSAMGRGLLPQGEKREDKRSWSEGSV